MLKPTPAQAPIQSLRLGQLQVKKVYFITHPNVAIDPEVPVPRWPLSERGFERMRAFLQQPFVQGITSVYCSNEQKAIDGAEVIANHLSLEIQTIEELGENDRSSTGYLPSDEFETVADQFFAHPDQSVRGWETANAAQQRISKAIDGVLSQDSGDGDIAIISHGGVGSLLLCQIKGYPIDRKHDQPGGGGGNYFCFSATNKQTLHSWKPIEPGESG
ncbi:histidine phosphatase family protein [Pelagicoccus mobilis]|uniref:Histidine phosphatase family protein n=1 Tax=Pelagicoccus mobilis TaxID=415221 RepID=A0A934RTI8_9BACT|nr:histidine phosphatase family protein [Pelagicoccus mobilis]MBK1877315.1 histidine phosphatase family protein [Pelagicoccus mobilis]